MVTFEYSKNYSIWFEMKNNIRTALIGWYYLYAAVGVNACSMTRQTLLVCPEARLPYVFHHVTNYCLPVSGSCQIITSWFTVPRSTPCTSYPGAEMNLKCSLIPSYESSLRTFTCQRIAVTTKCSHLTYT